MTDVLAFPGFQEPQQNWVKMPIALIENMGIISSLSEMKVIFYILRHTWGYQEFDTPKPITMDEFENGRKRKDGSRIDGGIGMSHNAIKSGLDNAQKHGFIQIAVDDTDKARVQKSYQLAMDASEAGGKSCPPGGQELPPGPPTIAPRSEKETLERNSRTKEKDSSPKGDSANETLFSVIQDHSFKDEPLSKSDGARIGVVVSWLKGNKPKKRTADRGIQQLEIPADVKELRKFYSWYRTTPEGQNADYPLDIVKFVRWFRDFRKLYPPAKPAPTPDEFVEITPEIAADLEALMAATLAKVGA